MYVQTWLLDRGSNFLQTDVYVHIWFHCLSELIYLKNILFLVLQYVLQYGFHMFIPLTCFAVFHLLLQSVSAYSTIFAVLVRD